jgi:hypothetical protein
MYMFALLEAPCQRVDSVVSAADGNVAITVFAWQKLTKRTAAAGW